MILILLTLLPILSSGCQLAGKQIGYCSGNPLFFNGFCKDHALGYTCVPAHNITWSQYDASYRDSQIKKMVLVNLQDQLILEYGQQTTNFQISNNRGCYEAYKKFTCQWNFPSCDPTTNSSMQMCQSVCTSFQTACGGTADACSIIYAKTDLGLNSNC